MFGKKKHSPEKKVITKIICPHEHAHKYFDSTIYLCDVIIPVSKAMVIDLQDPGWSRAMVWNYLFSYLRMHKVNTIL